MACGKNCGDNCGCCFEDGVATTTHQVDGCTVFDVVISSDPCNTVSLGSDGGLLVKECVEVFEDSLCDDATDPPTPFVRTTIIACDDTRTIVDTTPDGDPYIVIGNVVCCDDTEIVTTLTNTVLGHLIGTYTNELGVPVDINETITALGYNPVTNILTYTDETGAPTNVDLTALAIDINVASMMYNPLTGVITLTETDGSVHTIDIGPPVETVTTLVETPADKTATYTNEIGAITVLSETDFTANSTTIPATCEGLLANANILRELPVRWDTTTKTYKAYDDGNDASIMGENGVCFPAPPIGTYTAPLTTTINNPSTCKPLNVFYQYGFSPDVLTGANNLMIANVEMSLNGGPYALHYSGYHPGLNPGSIRGYGTGHRQNASILVIPPGGSLTIAIRGVVRYDTGAAGSIFYNYCLGSYFIGVTA